LRQFQPELLSPGRLQQMKAFRRQGKQKLIIFSITQGVMNFAVPGKPLGTKCMRNRKSFSPDFEPNPALPSHPMEITGKTIAQIHHGGWAKSPGEELSLPKTRLETEVFAKQAGAQGSGDTQDIALSRAGAPDHF